MIKNVKHRPPCWCHLAITGVVLIIIKYFTNEDGLGVITKACVCVCVCSWGGRGGRLKDKYGQMCGEGSGKTKRFAKRKVTAYKGQLMVLRNMKHLE